MKKPRFIKTIAGSRWANEAAASLVAGYIRLCHATSRWEREGFEDMNRHLREGQPVITVLWHEHLFMSVYLFDRRLGKICAITTRSRIAYLGQCALRRFGFESEMIDPNDKPIAHSRKMLRRIRDGYSIAISPDGTRGPARVAKPFPVQWAKAARIPVYCVAYSVRRRMRLPTWDRTMIPLPFNRGAFLVRRWDVEIPRDASEAGIEALAADLGRALDALAADAERRVRPGDAASRIG